MMFKILLWLAGLAIAGGQATAEQTVNLPAGAPINVQNVADLTSKHAQVGDQVAMEVSDDVVFNGHLLIAKGTPARGVVTDAHRNGHIGKPGMLTVDVVFIRLGDRLIRVRGQRRVDGIGGGGGTIATTVILSPLGLLVHGKSAKLPARTVFTAFTLGDEQFSVR